MIFIHELVVWDVITRYIQDPSGEIKFIVFNLGKADKLASYEIRRYLCNKVFLSSNRWLCNKIRNYFPMLHTDHYVDIERG